MYKDIYLGNPEATYEIGVKIGRQLKSGDVVCLYGDLGAGKTHITKGIGKSLGIDEDITSPTFIKVQEYNGRINLFHFDVYKVQSEEEMYFLGFDDYLNRDGVIIIEWAENIKNILPLNRIDISLKYLGDGRTLDIDFVGDNKVNQFDLEV